MAQDPPPPPPTQRQQQPSAAQLDEVRAAVRGLLRQPGYDDGSAGPVLVRLAWHSAGTYCRATGTGGSNGAGMRYEREGGDPANAGLQHARAFLEPLKRRFPWVTYADLWTLAAVVAIRESKQDQTHLIPLPRLPFSFSFGILVWFGFIWFGLAWLGWTYSVPPVSRCCRPGAGGAP